MDSFEWEIFKKTGNVKHYLMMKQREREDETYLEEFASEDDFKEFASRSASANN